MNDSTKAGGVPAVATPAIPDYLKSMQGQPVQSAAMDAMASAAMSIPRVSMRGKKFRFMEGGEEVFACNDSVEVVIIGVEPDTQRFIKTYYADKYAGAGDSNPPACASDDGVFPSGWVATPQSPTCAECPKNRFGSATSRTGKPSKACRDSKRLWVVRHDDLKGGEPNPVLYALGVTVMSLKSLSEFGRQMKSINVPISSAIVKVVMDDDSEFPMISFQHVGFLDQEKGVAAIARSEKAEWKSMQVTRPVLAAPAAGGSPLPLNVALPGQPVAAQATPVQAAAAPVQSGPVTIDQPAQAKPPASTADLISNW